MSSTVAPPAVRLTVRGDISRRAARAAQRKISAVLGGRHGGHWVLPARVVLERAGDPARDRPVRLEAAVDVDGTWVRVSVSAPDVHMAANLAADRLRQRLDHLRDRTRTRHRWLGEAARHSWRHGSVRSAVGRPQPQEGERRVIARAAVTGGPLTPDEAAYDMDLADHDFLLFVDATTGSDGLVYRTAAGLGVAGDVGPYTSDRVTPLTAAGPLPVLTLEQARLRLDTGLESFVAYRDAADGAGRVLYRRFDGHYGLVGSR